MTLPMLVYHLMKAELVSCRADDTLERAAQLMWENDIGFLPVVDLSEQLTGVITDRDALMAAYTRGAALVCLRVETAMAHEPITCTIHDEITAIEHRMVAHKIRRLPVVDDQHKPIGVVTLFDIARAAQHGHEVSPKGTSWALAAITEPRHVPRATPSFTDRYPDPRGDGRGTSACSGIP